ncbi:SpoIIE family protein phosphatase [Candidatus Margulisiibacteriota bacterium]
MIFRTLGKENSKKKKLSLIIDDLKDQILSKEEIIENLYQGLQCVFDESDITVYFLDHDNSEIELQKPLQNYWPIPISEKEWLLNRTKDILLNNKSENIDFLYIGDRDNSLYVDKQQLTKDQGFYKYNCSDGLYLVLVSEEEIVLGIVFIHHWKHRKKLNQIEGFEEKLKSTREFIFNIVQSIDNWLIHQKLEGLLFDNQELKLQIQKDKLKLNRRILELSILYDISNSLSSSVDHNQVVMQVLNSLYKVQTCDISSIYLLNFEPGGSISFHIHKNVTEEHIEVMKDSIASSMTPFLEKMPDKKQIKITKVYNFKAEEIPVSEPIRSFANIPIIFRNQILGLLSMSSISKSAFSRNKITFLHTVANQLGAHLGRLKTIKELEKSKITSLIESMTEGVIMIDKYNKLEIINRVAVKHLDLGNIENISSQLIIERLDKLDLKPYLQNSSKIYKAVLNKICSAKAKSLSVNITPVLNIEGDLAGTVFVLYDVTEIQKINRIKTQRLEVISKVSLLLNSISDLNNLLAILMEFILTIAEAEMGSIQLIEDNKIFTKVHSNFPEKILREYKLKTRETISNYVMRKKEICIIWDYLHNPDVLQNNKVLIDSYICLPLIVKNNLIGVVNIVRKINPDRPKFTYDDIKTLMTMASLAGTAIYNATLYNETMKKNIIDQEIKIASEIQNKLLPNTLPSIRNFQFGAISIPMRGIGGDYYDFFELKDGKLGIVIADIVGKGIGAGLFMAMLKSILNSHIPAFDSPKETLSYINETLYKDPVINKFIPLFFGVLDPSKSAIKYCNAGHEPAIIFSGDKFKTLDTKGFPLGAFLKSDYEEKEVGLKDNDIVLFFTDGLIEARNEKGNNFGYEQLKTLVKKYKGLRAEEIVNHIYCFMANKYNINVQHDDLTLVAFKVDSLEKEEKLEDTPIKVKKLRIASSKSNIKLIRKEVESLGQEIGLNESEIFNLKLAINEAQANIIEHAYMGKEDKEIYIQFSIYKHRVEILLKDFGGGLAQSSIKEGKQHLDILEGSGLGLFLIKSVMDDVKCNRIPNVGTELLLTKHFKERSI